MLGMATMAWSLTTQQLEDEWAVVVDHRRPFLFEQPSNNYPASPSFLISYHKNVLWDQPKKLL